MVIYTDGGARGNPGPAASAFVVYDKGEIIYEDAEFIGKKTNNFAEYSALIMALSWLLDNKEKFKDEEVKFFLDSELVTNQMLGDYKVKNINLIPLAMKAKELQKKIGGRFFFKHIPREKNKRADFLVNKKIDEKSS